ncbi:MAG: ammonium transporter, partial [Abditibacteriales bacterium]|nr:ammonium transporter [Abditibacteriales bacterium]MDW8368212.1 ammonium transporter [Abditibacteriales bacterium]
MRSRKLRRRGSLSPLVVAVMGTGIGVLLSAPAWAGEAEAKIDTGDTAWMLVSTALVMLMTPGLALFYGGMVRQKNVLGTIMQSFIAVALISIQWLLWGYSLAFAPGNAFIGGLSYVGLQGVGLTDSHPNAATIPHQLFMMYQGMFAIITPALITGAFAERKKFSTYLVFLLLWATLVYDPIAHWVWAPDGWLFKQGALDFAGGTVVHISSGVSALVCVLVMGKRRGYGREEMTPHNLTMTVLGTALLWFGWFGFNGGSAVSSGSLAVSAFVVTNMAAAAATLAWMFVEWAHRGKPTVLGAVSGAVAGLVGITPASGFVTPMASLVIGAAAGIACYLAVNLKSKFGYDDSLDTFGIHGIGGTVGAILTGVFAVKVIPEAPNNVGLLAGNPGQLGIQLLGVVATWVYSAVVTLVILK